MKAHSASRLMAGILALLAFPIIVLVSQRVQAAGSWYVATGGSDGNSCLSPGAACATINGAIAKADSGDTIYVVTGTYTGTGDDVVSLSKDVTLSGGWNGAFTIQNGTSTIDGEDARRGMSVASGVTAIVERFTVHGGSAKWFGGIRIDGTLALSNSTISSNTASLTGGGIGNGGTLTLDGRAVSGNTASNGGGIHNWGTLTLNNGTISGNTADYGGGIYNHSGSLALNNGTVSGNAGRYGGGIHNDDTLTISSSTVSDNSPEVAGGGIYNEGTMTLQNTIVAGNAGSSALDCLGTIGSSGFNLVGDTSGFAFDSTTGDLTNIDARLAPLEGSLGYHPLLPGSPAIDAGGPASCVGSTGLLASDQRGFPRFGTCDTGAYEMQPIGYSTKTANQSTCLPGDPVTYTVSLDNGSDANITNVRMTDTLPVFLTYIHDSLTATGGSYGYANRVISWTGSVDAGGAVAIAFGATVSPTVAFGTSITNSAVISGGGEIITRSATVIVEGRICHLAKYAENPILSVGAAGKWDDDDVWGPTVVKEGGSYKMWYTGDDGSNPSQIGLATSPDGISWTKEVGNPVLSPSETWEGEGIRASSVIYDSGLFSMWYTGFDSSGVGRIGYATSPDGVTWTKYGGNPVLDVGPSESWESEDVMKPTVIREMDTYHVWYEGYDGITIRIGHAASSDGINWTRDPATPVLDVGPPGDWDWLHVYGPSVVSYNGRLFLWYSGGTLPMAWQTGCATSPNGNQWTRGEMLIAEGAPGTFDADRADYPSVIVDSTGFKVWYSGHDGDTYAIGYATTEICSEPSRPYANSIYLPLVMRNWHSCPAYYTDDFGDVSSGWPVDDNSNRRYAYTGGQYQIWVKNPSQGWGVTPGCKATDFTVAVSARRASGSSGAYGIQFGINRDWSEFYEILIDADYYSIWRYYGGWSALRNWTSSGHINTGTSWNRLKVIREGADIAVYVNSQHLATVADGSFTGLRRMGLVAHSPASGSVDARFDDFSLYLASCGVGVAAHGMEMGGPGIHGAPMSPGMSPRPKGHWSKGRSAAGGSDTRLNLGR